MMRKDLLLYSESSVLQSQSFMLTFSASGCRNRILRSTNETNLEKQSPFLRNLFLYCICNWHLSFHYSDQVHWRILLFSHLTFDDGDLTGFSIGETCAGNSELRAHVPKIAFMGNARKTTIVLIS